jgi:hypothetical protein
VKLRSELEEIDIALIGTHIQMVTIESNQSDGTTDGNEMYKCPESRSEPVFANGDLSILSACRCRKSG